MRKSLVLVVAMAAFAFAGCTTMTSNAPASAANGADPYHLMRSEQLAVIPEGSTVGILGSGSPLSLFIGAAMDTRGLVIRELSLYTLLPGNQIATIAPGEEYTFLNSLAAETLKLAHESAQVGVVVEDVATVAGEPMDLDSLVNRLYDTDDLVAENQRANHYLELVQSLRKMVSELNVDYILVSGMPYSGLSYSTRIYDTKTLDVVFRDLIVADEAEWRRVVPAPKMENGISFDYTAENEPVPYWDLSYAEFMVSKLEIE